MAASYPSSLKSFTTKIDFDTTVLADHVNSLQEEVVAIETILGTAPSVSSGWTGTFDSTTTAWANVKSRINNLEYGLKNVHDKVGGTSILPVANGGTGISSLGSGVATFLGTPSSSNLASAVTDETGSGALVFGTSPTIATPTLTLSSTSSSSTGRVAWDNTNFQFDVGDGSTVRTITADDATATLSNKSLTKPILTTPVESWNIVASAATGTININAATSGVWYYTSNASANFTLNFRGSSSVTMDSFLAVGQAVTVVFLNTNGSTAYYPNIFQIDGNAVTPKWGNGITPTAGSASAIDAYQFTIIKTAATPTYVVLAGTGKYS